MNQKQAQAAALAFCIAAIVALSGCGSQPVPGTGTTSSVHVTGAVHGGQQPVANAHVYLYAVSTSAGGASTSLLNAPGYVPTDVNGNFSITNDYNCPANAYVYLLALGGNPGVLTGSNSELALAAGLGACSGLRASQNFSINEVTTVALAYTMATSATSDVSIGAAAGANGGNPLAAGFAAIDAFTDPVSGSALGATAAGSPLPQAQINSLANALAACVDTDGSGGTCATLMSDAGVTTGGSTPVDTFQAALKIAQNPTTVNVSDIYKLGTGTGPFQPTLSSAPANWALAVPGYTPPSASYTTPGFFNGETALGNGVYYLVFPNGHYFGYYSFLTDPRYIYHFDLGYEYVIDAQDGMGGVYLYDFTSDHYWYTSPAYPFPYLYDFTLRTELYYYPDPNNPGRYNTNGVRYFYDFATGQIITL